MNRLFEQFVTRWLTDLGRKRGWQVLSQHSEASVIWDLTNNSSYARIRPDILLKPVAASGPVLPVDAKYKLYDNKDLNNADVYQAFLYAATIAGSSAQIAPRQALLIYPTTRDSAMPKTLEIRSAQGQGLARLQAVGIDVNEILTGINQDQPLSAVSLPRWLAVYC